MSRVGVASAIVLLFAGATPTTAHVPPSCEQQLDQLTVHYDEREAKLAKAEGFNARLTDINGRAATATKAEIAELLIDFWLWAGDYVTHEGTTASAISRLLGCIADARD